MTELERAQADEKYWSDWAEPFGLTVVGWTYRNSATFRDDSTGSWVNIEGPIFRIMDRIRPVLVGQRS